ncbi:DNA alkylation repair protein [Microbacter sp. GSS18]|nr:DNA alkylation repair protein [Microbacter sp. GSS18]
MSIADTIRERLAAAGDPDRAAGQQAYMRSAMRFRGVRLPDVRTIAKHALPDRPEPEALLNAATDLWDDAAYREERYAALAIIAHRRLRGDRRVVPLIEHMVRSGRWWDITDDAAHRVRDLLDAAPGETARLIRGWSVDDDLWMRRLAIISQLGRRDRTDAVLLADVLEPNLGDSDVFIRKAVGWALRDYARAAPDWVRSYVDAHELSPLSRREALRHL